MFPQTKSIICFIAMQSYKRENCAGKCKSLHEYKTCLVMHEEHAYSASVWQYTKVAGKVYIFIFNVDCKPEISGQNSWICWHSWDF